MLPIRLAAVLTGCVLLPPSGSAFVVVPTGPSLVSRGSPCRKATAVRSHARAATSSRYAWCDGRSSPASRTTIVLQAASDGSEQLREQQQQQPTEQQAAARSKQLNVACNDVVRTILDGNPSNEKERAEALRQRLIAQKDELVSPGDDMSALFFDNLLLVCQHELHPDIGILRGNYGKAWSTILHYIEDAGWQLTDPPFSISG